MATLVIKHSVADYAAWRAVYDAGQALRSKHGGNGGRILHEDGDHNALLVLIDFPSVEAAKTFAGEPELASAMQNAGVTGPPTIGYYLEE